MERRLAAILAADVVGYSRLMSADESGTLTALKSLRKDLFDPGGAKRGGRVVKQMGDGVLVEFVSVVETPPKLHLRSSELWRRMTTPSAFASASIAATSSSTATIFSSATA